VRKILPFLIVFAAVSSAFAANPVPTITSINPNSCLAGSPQFTLTVNGTNFIANSTVNWNGTALTTTFVSSTQVTAIVPAANVATAGTAQVTVRNPPPGGGTSNVATFTINNPAPTTSSISPTCATAGGAQFTLTVNGTNFVPTSTVKWNATTLATTFVSSTQLTATVTAALIATPGTASINVVNPAPGGGTSNAQTFTIAATPVITSPLTACGTVGVAFSYTITATNNPTSFNASPLPAGLSVNTSTGVISGTPTATGTTNVTITASNGAGPCNTSAQQTLVITISSRPTISSLNPNCAAAGGAQFTLTVNGTNFASTSTVNWNGSPLATTFVSATQLTAIVPASLIATAGTAPITVVNPNSCGGGATSSPVTFTIAAAPVITSPLTACGTVGAAFSYTITATNNPTSFTASPLPAGLSVNTSTGVISGTPTTGGTTNVTITASNGASPCNTATATLVITISAAPTISSLNPTCATAGGPQFTLTVNGNNFVSGATVKWNATSLVTTFVSATQLTATVPTSLIATAGTASVTVVSPCGGTSNTATFTINAAPTISSLNPTCVAAGGPQFTLTVNGTNFPSGSTVKWNGTSLTTSGSGTQLTATVPATLIATPGTASITVVTPCGGTSNAMTFTIANTPVITSPLTACGSVGTPFSYTITATNNPTSFTASPLPNGLTVNTSTGVISGTPTRTGTTSVTVTASNGGGPCNTATATLVITIGNAPTISSISPTCTGAGGPDFTLTVNGPNNDFIQGDTVYWNGSPLPCPVGGCFVNSRQLTATVPAALIATPGTASITVGGCGGTSGGVTFTVSATPTMTSLSPACASAGDPQFTLTVNGTNFVSTSTVNWNGSPLSTTFISLTQLTATVPASLIANPTTASITVASPCGATSSSVAFPVADAPSINPPLTASATLGTPFSYQITANNNPTSFDALDLPGGLTVCHNSAEGCTPGLISGTPTATGTFPVTISATNNSSDPCSGTATDTLTLTVTLPGGVFIPPFPGQVNVFGWGPTPPSSNATIPFPNATTDNYFVLYWNSPGSNTNQAIADSANGGLRRSADNTGMSYNPYDPTISNARPDSTKNVWRGNPIPPNDNTSGQFGDPRASWYITDPWPTADYVTASYWGGPNPNVVPLNWPDSGHPFSYAGVQPADKGQYPIDIMASPTPSPDPTKSISLLSDPNRPNAGNLTSITELGNVWDPAQLSYTVTNPGGALPDIPTSALRDARGAGGHTLAIGRPEFSMFDQNGMRAWQLLDLFSAKTSNTNVTNTAGLVNLNTASRDVLRSLAAGILQNRDPAIQPPSLQSNLYPPTRNAGQEQQADKFADAVINSRPLLSTAALSAITECGKNISCGGGQSNRPLFGNPNQYENSTQTPPTEWNDPGREELFAKIYNLATTRSRNFRVFVTGQSLDKNGNVLSTVTKVYHVFIKPNRDPTTGAIQSQQVQIKYEGSM